MAIAQEIATRYYVSTKIHRPLEENDPYLSLREEHNASLYAKFAIQSGHPDIVSPATRNNPALVRVEPSLSMRFSDTADENSAIISGGTKCLSHALNRTDLGVTRPVEYARNLLSLPQNKRDN